MSKFISTFKTRRRVTRRCRCIRFIILHLMIAFVDPSLRSPEFSRFLNNLRSTILVLYFHFAGPSLYFQYHSLGPGYHRVGPGTSMYTSFVFHLYYVWFTILSGPGTSTILSGPGTSTIAMSRPRLLAPHLLLLRRRRSSPPTYSKSQQKNLRYGSQLFSALRLLLPRRRRRRRRRQRRRKRMEKRTVISDHKDMEMH